MCANLSIYLSIYLPTYVSSYLSIYCGWKKSETSWPLAFLIIYIYSFNHPRWWRISSIHRIYLSLPIYLSTYLRIYLSTYQSINPILSRCAAQGGGGSFKNRKPIGEVGCCESRMAEPIHWWTERWLGLCFLEWLQWLQWSPGRWPHPQLLDVVWCSAAVFVAVA